MRHYNKKTIISGKQKHDIISWSTKVITS